MSAVWSLTWLAGMTAAAAFRVVVPGEQPGPPVTPPYVGADVVPPGSGAGLGTRNVVNPGGPLSLAQPNIYRGVLPRRECGNGWS
jgi:hypothetical protein